MCVLGSAELGLPGPSGRPRVLGSEVSRPGCQLTWGGDRLRGAPVSCRRSSLSTARPSTRPTGKTRTWWTLWGSECPASRLDGWPILPGGWAMLGGLRPGRGPRGGPPEGSPRPLCIPPSLLGTRPLLSLPAPWSLCPGSATTRWMDAWTGAASTGSTLCRRGSLCECSPALLRGLWGFPSGVRFPLRQCGRFSDKNKQNTEEKKHPHKAFPSWGGGGRGPVPLAWALRPRPPM